MNSSYVSRPHRYSSLGRILLLLIGLGLVSALFFVKTRAFEARAYVKKLENNLVQERVEIRMISAEIAHLENPDRLRRLAREYLDLQTVSAQQVLTFEEAVKKLQEHDVRQSPKVKLGGKR
ncbi:MAG: hypothetical protein JKX72_11750 [Robiginitomaculum sp.]|nr:hypothetical protein [Robiginitomaculum sp.]